MQAWVSAPRSRISDGDVAIASVRMEVICDVLQGCGDPGADIMAIYTDRLESLTAQARSASG